MARPDQYFRRDPNFPSREMFVMHFGDDVETYVQARDLIPSADVVYVGYDVPQRIASLTIWHPTAMVVFANGQDLQCNSAQWVRIAR
jgi:hypothetical protein